MKCLSVHQPWADLEVDGKRDMEVRKWLTGYVGWLLIHAGLKVEQKECERLRMNPGITGAIIGAVYLYQVVRVSAVQWRLWRSRHLERGGRCYGRRTFCWLFSNPMRFRKPIPYTGVLGLFNVPDHSEAVDQARKALDRMRKTDKDRIGKNILFAS